MNNTHPTWTLGENETDQDARMWRDILIVYLIRSTILILGGIAAGWQIAKWLYS